MEENSMFNNSNHLEWRAGVSDTILIGDHPSSFDVEQQSPTFSVVFII